MMGLTQYSYALCSFHCNFLFPSLTKLLLPFRLVLLALQATKNDTMILLWFRICTLGSFLHGFDKGGEDGEGMHPEVSVS